MISTKILLIILSAAIFGLQALAGPIPNQELNQITTFKETYHIGQNAFLNSLNGILRKRFSAFIIDPRTPPSDGSHHWGPSDSLPGIAEAPNDQLAARSLASRAAAPNIKARDVTFTPEEKAVLHSKLWARFPFFDTRDLNTITPIGFLATLLVIGTVGGALLMFFPTGWLF